MDNQTLYHLGRYSTAALRLLPAEKAHDIGLWMLERGFARLLPPYRPMIPLNILQVDVPGIGRLRHPIGLAAGFDKNARCPSGFEQMGCSAIEIGTVTPKAQTGNPRPRLFRYPETSSIINRMGFNSHGFQRVHDRLRQLNWSPAQVPLGINLGKNKDTPTESAISDYLLGIERFAPYASWITINISSPNTPGLRSLATPEFLKQLADASKSKVSKCWIKLDPDLDKKTLQELVQTVGQEGFAGLILSNTHRVTWPQSGGLSGHTLLSLANQSLEWAWDVSKGSIPTIASGGVLTGADVYQKLIRGACAVQIYTALVYRGPYAVGRMCEELHQELQLNGFHSATECIGTLYQ